MSVSSEGPKGNPQFESTGNAPTFAADLTAVSDYSAEVGNRVAGTAAERGAYTAWAGLEWFETDTGLTYLYTGSAWRLTDYVKHAEYTWAQSVANTTLTALASTPTLVAANSVASPTTFFTPTSTGFTAVSAGVYFIDVHADLTSLATGRSFIELAGPSGGPYRDGTQGDDKMSIGKSLYLGAGQAVALNFFQTTGATRSMTGRLHIDYFGPK